MITSRDEDEQLQGAHGRDNGRVSHGLDARDISARGPGNDRTERSERTERGQGNSGRSRGERLRERGRGGHGMQLALVRDGDLKGMGMIGPDGTMVPARLANSGVAASLGALAPRPVGRSVSLPPASVDGNGERGLARGADASSRVERRGRDEDIDVALSPREGAQDGSKAPADPQDELSPARPSKKSRGDMAIMSKRSLEKILECLVCMDTIRPPIFQCKEGHLLCSQCRSKLPRCPACRDAVGLACGVRNRALEQLAREFEFRCQFPGCSEQILYDHLNKHEQRCEFAPLTCPHASSQCDWTGSSADDVLKHLIQKHSVRQCRSDTINATYTNTKGRANVFWTERIFSCHGQHFILSFRHRMVGSGFGEFVALLQHITGKHGCEGGFAYELSAQKGEWAVSYSAKPSSIRSAASSIFARHDCLIIKQNMAMYFSKSNFQGNEDLNKLDLTLTGRIRALPDA